jgi:hypothetical protein
MMDFLSIHSRNVNSVQHIVKPARKLRITALSVVPQGYILQYVLANQINLTWINIVLLWIVLKKVMFLYVLLGPVLSVIKWMFFNVYFAQKGA